MAEILFLLVMKGKTIKAALMDHVLSTRFSKMEKKSECHQSYNLAGATLYEVALSTTLLKSNMVIYKKRHKEVNNICCSNPTSGSNFFKKPVWVLLCKKHHSGTNKKPGKDLNIQKKNIIK